MLSSQRTSVKIVVAVLGVLGLGIPILAFNAWLTKQGDDEIPTAAAWALSSAETQLGQTVAALYDISRRGVDSCKPAHIEAMHQATVRTGAIKQVMLIAPNGQIMCTDSGAVIDRTEVISTASTASADIMLDVVRLSEGRARFLRVRKTGEQERPAVAALVPASLLLPPAWLPGGRIPGDVRMTMGDGTPVGGTLVTDDIAGAREARFQRRVQSNQYGFVVTVTSASKGVVANYDDLRRIGMVVSGAIALIVLGIALGIMRRQSHTPIAELARAILANEFQPYYQPVVDIQTGRLLGAEVLVRWRRADGSLVEPNAFISLMETSGLMPEMTRSLMRRVRKDMGEAVGRRPEMTIAFNVVPHHFDDALILNDVGTIFDGSPIRLTQIVLELTERHEVENLGKTRRAIAALQGMGCKVAIDDVGTGHSGLSYILKLGVDIIKIDKIFVEAIGSEGHSKRDHRDADRSRQEHAHGDHRRGRRDLRPGDLSARARDRGGAGLCVRAAVAGCRVPATARSHGPDRGGGGDACHVRGRTEIGGFRLAARGSRRSELTLC